MRRRTEVASVEQWRAFIAHERADGNHADADAMEAGRSSYVLVRKSEGTETEYMPPAGWTEERTMTKQWQHMDFNEKHALWRTDPVTAKALRDAEPTFAGKTWSQMTNEERARCWREDRATFIRMQEAAR